MAAFLLSLLIILRAVGLLRQLSVRSVIHDEIGHCFNLFPQATEDQHLMQEYLQAWLDHGLSNIRSEQIIFMIADISAESADITAGFRNGLNDVSQIVLALGIIIVQIYQMFI